MTLLFFYCMHVAVSLQMLLQMNTRISAYGEMEKIQFICKYIGGGMNNHHQMSVQSFPCSLWLHNRSIVYDPCDHIY